MHTGHAAGSDGGRGDAAGKTTTAAGRRRRRITWLILIAYALLLIWRVLHYGQDHDVVNVAVWELHDSHRLLGWLGGLLLTGLREFAYFVPVGLAASLGLSPGAGPFRRLRTAIGALVVGIAVAVLVRAVETGLSWHAGAVAAMALSVLGCLFGAWMGMAWLGGWRARLWFLPKVAFLAVLAALGIGIVLWLSMEEMPLPFEAAPVTSAEKRRLVHLIRGKSPRSLEEGQTHTLRLTEHDINVLLAWGLSLGSPARKANVRLAADSASLSVSIGVPLGRAGPRYLNLAVAGGVQLEERVLRLDVDQCRLGSVELPRRFLSSLCPAVASLLSHDRRTKPFLDAIRAIAIEPNSIEVTYGRVHLPPGFREDIFGPAVANEDVLASTRIQADRLLAVVSQLPRAQPSLELCLETVFALARDRSIRGDPIVENQAGILALGILLGHPRIEEFLGPVLPEDNRGRARWVLRRVPLRGRSDWTKHFCVSAAIAVFSDEAVSDAAGLLKEELDADVGGSGFSFADLLADRAGTTFAMRATRDEAAARAMQDRIAKGFRVEEFFPSAADLPEGISDAELQSQYGGVGGREYRRLIEEIERRIAACAAYREPQ